MEPFRDLIKPNCTFFWDDNLTKLFEESKKLIIDLVKDGIRTFDLKRRTCLQTDWSRDGIGYLLLQKYCECQEDSPVCCPDGWKLVLAGSRFLNPTESRYAPTEGEALAVSWSLKHSRMFTLGCNDLLVVVDHKPLLGILNKERNIETISNPRLQNLKEQTFAWNFSIAHCPGKWQRGPDALSRFPTKEHPNENPSTADIQTEIATITALSNFENISVTHVRKAGQSDEQYTELLKMIEMGFPATKKDVPLQLREFWAVHERLSAADGIAMMDTRIVIPRSLRKQIITNLHAANQGIGGMKARANISVYWPGMDGQMREYKNNCADCLKHSPSQRAEPLILTPSPEWPFQQVCADYLEINGHAYLSIVDRFSGWLCIFHLKPNQRSADTLINICRDLFTAYGAPEVFCCDGGPQFIANKFKEFLSLWNVEQQISSAGYPQSNGRAELGVKSAKRIIHNNTSPDGSLNNELAARAILQYRNTPLADINLSPAQILLHRQLRDSIPESPSHYKPHKEWILTAKKREMALSNRNHRIITDYRASSVPLPSIPVGSKVILQSRNNLGKKMWVKTGKVVQALENRQYKIRMDHSGRITLQNRKFLKPCQIVGPPLPNMSPASQPTQSVPVQPNSENVSDIQNDVPAHVPVHAPVQIPAHPPVHAPDHVPDQVPDDLPADDDQNGTVHQEPNVPRPQRQRIPAALKRLAAHNQPGAKGLPGDAR